MDLYTKVCPLALPKPASDHCSTLLDSKCERCGHSLFRFEILWLEENNFQNQISMWQKEIEAQGWAGLILASKLKALKVKIKDQTKTNFVDLDSKKGALLEEIQRIDRQKEQGFISSEDASKRIALKEEFSKRLLQEELKWK